MRLCFGDFAELLWKYKKSSAVSREQIGRALLDFIDPDFVSSKEASYIYSFMNRKRELPADLKRHEFEQNQLTEQFDAFAQKHLNPAYEALLSELAMLIQDDEYIDERTQEALLDYLAEPDPPRCLSELFAFIVGNTNNLARTDELRIRRHSLLAQVEATENNVRLGKIAVKAMDKPDTEALSRCFAKMTNAVYVANTLIALCRNSHFALFAESFHTELTKLENNKYRLQVLSECIKEGYYSEHPAELLDAHFGKFTNNRYAYDLLVFLVGQDLRELAEQYQSQLTSALYAKRFAAYLSDG
jgi:hypothetical protein